MSKVEDYRKKLRKLDSWDSYLLAESRLPGPRANLELAFAVAMEGSEDQLVKYAELGPEEAERDTKEEFLAVCGVIGLGYLAARGVSGHFDLIRKRAGDPRWRIREAVALGMQKYGETSFDDLLVLMIDWSQGSLLERRAVVATLCEPTLLRDDFHAARIVDLLDEITSSIINEVNRRSDDFRVLRKALGYGWSVAVAAHPESGKPRMEIWIQTLDGDIRWIMKNNLKKNRLVKMDPEWVEAQIQAISS